MAVSWNAILLINEGRRRGAAVIISWWLTLCFLCSSPLHSGPGSVSSKPAAMMQRRDICLKETQEVAPDCTAEKDIS